MRRFVRISIGSLLILLGVIGLFLPVLQGWLFMGLGVVMLARDLPLFVRIIDWITDRYPGFGRVLQRLRGSPPTCAK
jgi:uncharacterized protein